jgi:hypothetical protein
MWLRPWRGHMSKRHQGAQVHKLNNFLLRAAIRRWAADDNGRRCDLQLRSRRGGDNVGCSKCRAQIWGGDDVFLQEQWRRCPRKNDWRRVGRLSACLMKTGGEGCHLLKRQRHQWMWLNHEHHRCSLEGATTISSFGSVDDEAATDGRATQTW